MISDIELLQLLNSGNENAIKQIFDKYYEGLCLYSEGIIKDRQKAEEIVEDIFIYLWVNIKKSPINLSIKNYLYRSTHNNCLKYLNHLKVEKKHIDFSNYTIFDQEILHPLSPEYPISNLIIKELEDKAEKILSNLPKQCKEIYTLNRFENLNYTEIALRLNITVGTVKTQMSRAFQKFRKELKEFIPLILFMF